MAEKTKIYGFKFRDLPSGHRLPDCHWIIRWAQAKLWTFLFHAVPIEWIMFRKGLRLWIVSEILARYGYWAATNEVWLDSRDWKELPKV